MRNTGLKSSVTYTQGLQQLIGMPITLLATADG